MESYIPVVAFSSVSYAKVLFPIGPLSLRRFAYVALPLSLRVDSEEEEEEEEDRVGEGRK
jgi:hypothetical protein